MEDWVAYLELAFCTKYSLLNCLHTVRLKDYYILFNALPVLKKQFVVRAFSNYAPRFMNVLPQTLERLQFLNSLSPTAENPPVLGWVLNWCIDCFHYLFFFQYSFRLLFGVFFFGGGFWVFFWGVAVSLRYHYCAMSMTCTWKMEDGRSACIQSSSPSISLLQETRIAVLG